ncbi:cation:proton antiporter [Streptomyces adelaidensis]|uniref:cation:proton antiporter n=1 Tax=Streptomyces adelaidensis TaxID=2796465 RepID=UPI00190540B1|nr:cation:proton antiporter [Streptomyces adelaidensis]
MDVLDLLLRTTHAVAALAVVLLFAAAGRSAARRLRQPEVIGEITVGLLAGPAVIALFGTAFLDAVLPGPVFDILTLFGQAGLVLFLVGLAHKLRIGPDRPPHRTMGWVVAGSLVPPLLTGLLLTGWVSLTGGAAVRGTAPLPAFVLMVAVAMSITAVPVMSRILADRGMGESPAGRLALASAIAIDAVGWLLLTVAISLGAGDLTGSLHSARALLFGAVCALAVRYGLRTRAARGICVRLPRTTAVALGASALGVALVMEHLGMTAILGAALVGLAVPGDERAPWAGAVSTVSRVGRALAPAFFVVTGITVLTRAFAAASWSLIAVAVVLGCAGKVLGGYAGARLGGLPRSTACRIGVLVNTRGLTELIVLQAGLSAGVLSAPLVLALVVMALVTTAMTGPLLNALDRRDERRARRRTERLTVRLPGRIPQHRSDRDKLPVETEGGTR